VALGVSEQLVGLDAVSAGLSQLSDVPEIASLPIVDLAHAAQRSPDLVLTSALVNEDARAVVELESQGAQLVEFAPHDLEDVFALCRGLGARLVGVAAATRFERSIARPLALVGGLSSPVDRPRVLAVTGLAPLTFAGGHSFETDLIEIGGGSSVTHGGEENRLPASAGDWDTLAPDLVVVMMSGKPTARDRWRADQWIPDGYRVEFFDFDAQWFWLEDPVEDARRMRQLIVSVGEVTRRPDPAWTEQRNPSPPGDGLR
jgi:ABC-type Fe3+-hydroxamate transport system substrate-binding protein